MCFVHHRTATGTPRTTTCHAYLLRSKMLNPVFACLQARVQSLGGEIMYWNGDRVMGVLAVSRAIGDHNLRPFVIAQPEVSSLLPVLAAFIL